MNTRFLAQGNPSENGFTLVETLVAIVLLSLAMKFIVTSIVASRQGIDAAERIGIRSTEAAQNFLRSALKEARTLETDPSFQRNESFRGSSRSFAFTTSYIPAALKMGMAKIQVDLVPARTASGLLDLNVSFYTRSTKENAEAPPPAFATTLVTGLSRAMFRYFGEQRTLDGRDWSENWSEVRDLPSLVAIDIEFPAGDARVWRPLVVPLLTRQPISPKCVPYGGCG